MNDPLKKFVEAHREEFDDLQVPAHLFSEIKSKLPGHPIKKNGGVTRLLWTKIAIAASILLVIGIGFWRSNDSTQYLATDKSTPIAKRNALPVQVEEPKVEFVAHELRNNKKSIRQKKSLPVDLLALYEKMSDSTSASTRLAAILALQKSNIINYDIVDRLTNTLNHDASSNVRLAALNLMSKYAGDSYVNNAFMLSLSNQTDPLLQMGLMDLLRQTNNPKLDDRLYALATDPNTLNEVKDQAYSILLAQNKL